MSITIDLTPNRVNYFNDFMNNITLNPNDYSNSTLKKFHELFQREFYGKDDINKFLVLTPIQLQVAQVLYYMYSRYNTITFKGTLKGDSVNGKMLFMETLNRRGDNESIFVKFQVKPTADDIRVDGLNAFILNMVAPYSTHFMEYHDMFRTLCLEDVTTKQYFWDLQNQINNGLLIVNLDIKPHTPGNEKKVRNIYSLINQGKSLPFVLPYNNPFLERIQIRNQPNNEHIITAFAAQRIHGASLHNCLQNVTINHIFSMANTIYELFRTLYSLRKVGFIHNDAHTCNILWDKYKHSFCLIDYGRSSVSVSLLQNDLKNKIKEYTEYVLLNTDEYYLLNSYDSYYNIPPTTKKTYEEFVHVGRTGWISEGLIVMNIPNDIKKQKLFKKWMVMFDILTITLGVYSGLKKDIRDKIEDVYYQGNIFMLTKDLIGVMILDDLLPIIESPVFISNLQANNLEVFLPGIIWLSVIFTALHKIYPFILKLTPKDPSNPNDYSFIAAERISLANENIMFTSFQCLRRCCHPNICDLIPSVATIIETLFPNSMYTGIRSSNSSLKSNSSKELSGSPMHTSSGGDKSTNSKIKDIRAIFDSLPDTGMEEAYTKYNRTDPSNELKKLLQSYKGSNTKSNMQKPKVSFNVAMSYSTAQAAGGISKMKNYINNIPSLEPKYEELIEKLRYYKPF